MRNLTRQMTLGMAVVVPLLTMTCHAETRHVWEKLEVTLESQRQYENAYTDVRVWVDLKGPGYDRRCYGFWDGGSTFRVRILATAAGRWTWESGANVADPGLRGVRGDRVDARRTGRWLEGEARANTITVDAKGRLRLPQFPDGKSTAKTDWALKLQRPADA